MCFVIVCGVAVVTCCRPRILSCICCWVCCWWLLLAGCCYRCWQSVIYVDVLMCVGVPVRARICVSACVCVSVCVSAFVCARVSVHMRVCEYVMYGRRIQSTSIWRLPKLLLVFLSIPPRLRHLRATCTRWSIGTWNTYRLGALFLLRFWSFCGWRASKQFTGIWCAFFL